MNVVVKVNVNDLQNHPQEFELFSTLYEFNARPERPQYYPYRHTSELKRKFWGYEEFHSFYLADILVLRIVISSDFRQGWLEFTYNPVEFPFFWSHLKTK